MHAVNNDILIIDFDRDLNWDATGTDNLSQSQIRGLKTNPCHDLVTHESKSCVAIKIRIITNSLINDAIKMCIQINTWELNFSDQEPLMSA